MPFLGKGKNNNERRQFTGDPEDYRLSLVEHLEELRDRIINSIVIIVVTWTAGWFLVMPLFGYLNEMAVKAIKPVLPKSAEYKEVFHTAGAAFLLKFKLSFFIGLIIAFPLITLQIWWFIMPALKVKEQQVVRKIAPFTVVLFAMGVGFAWVVLPSAMRWFASYIEEFPGTSLYQEAGSMVFLILKILAAFGVAFQLPLVVYILGALELLSAETLLKHWRQAATAIFVIAMIVTPSQDPLTMLMMAIPLVILFMISVYVVKFTQARKRKARLLNPEDDETRSNPFE